MCGDGGGSTPRADPVAEREKAQAEATQKANQELLTTARRKRLGLGLLSSSQGVGTAMAKAAPAPVQGVPTRDEMNSRSFTGDWYSQT